MDLSAHINRMRAVRIRKRSQVFDVAWTDVKMPRALKIIFFFLFSQFSLRIVPIVELTANFDTHSPSIVYSVGIPATSGLRDSPRDLSPRGCADALALNLVSSFQYLHIQVEDTIQERWNWAPSSRKETRVLGES